MLVASALAMTMSAGILLLVQRSRAVARVDTGIAADVQQFRSLAAGELSPQDSPVFADVATLLQIAVQRQVPAEDQTFLALIDGVPRFVPSGDRPVQLENDEELLRTLAALPPQAPPRVLSTDTASGTVRYAAVQVSVAGRPEGGTYVVAYALAPGEAALAEAAQLYALVAGGSLVLVGIVGWFVAGRLLSPLHLLAAAAKDISHADLSLRIPVAGNDDISELTRIVNAMLARLEMAFDTQRHFLDDAGHELRTPLTIIRGHLEIVDPRRADDVIDTHALVLDELDRMARLVDDLTMLARSQRPDFVRMSPVDLDAFLDQVWDKASALGDRQWIVDARSTGWIMADEQRLTQALLQLSDNAVKHTVDGDVIALGLSTGGSGIDLWVRDTGTGIADAELGRIFERFGRGTSARGDGGSGLGLSIVAAIAAAHGGRARVRSTLGVGSTFTIVIPMTSALPPHGYEAQLEGN